MSEKSDKAKTREYISEKFTTTELGFFRIARNLNLSGMSNDDILVHCRKIIVSTPDEKMELRGKNYYLYSSKYSAVLTVNKSSLGIITAKKWSGSVAPAD